MIGGNKMVARYKKSLEKATLMLNIIKNSDLAAGAIVDLQLFLLQRITNGEDGVSRCKDAIKDLRSEKANGRPSRERSKEIDKEIEKFEGKREDYKYIIYIWKCFGDGIAFHYCDKYALKHLLYDDQYRVKETAGFVSGKDGLKNEIFFLKEAAKHNVPAVLCDLTNTLRHGDICLLGGSDPLPIEIKSSPKLNERGERQLKNISQINSFFTNDEAENFRNQGMTVRHEHIGNERNHRKAINKCISRAFSEGTACISPENGIFYFAITELKEEVLDVIKGKHIHAINLNDCKRSMNWQPYTPFTLLLEPKHVFDFIAGNFTILVMFDLQIIKKRYKNAGMDINFLKEINWYAQISKRGVISEGGFRVSEQSFLRLAFEFQSLTWGIKQHKSELDKLLELNSAPGTEMEIPKEWLDVDDGIPAL
jgi:hypothetical protein